MPLDFQVDWKGNEEETSNEIIRHLLCKKLDAGMPVVIGAVGKSRHGKTRWMLKVQEIVYAWYGLKFVDYLDKVVMIKAKDWTTKIRPILEEKDKDLKNIKSLHLDEAKFVVSTDDWQKVKNKALRAVIGVGAVVQPMIIIIIAQIRGDIDPRVRVTLDYLFEVKRSPDNKPRVTCTIPYEKVYDMNNIKILPRALEGIINYPNGEKQHVFPVFYPSLPSKEVEAAYDAFEKPDKKQQLIRLLDEVDKDARKLEQNQEDIFELANLLIENPNEMETVSKFRDGKWRLNYKEAKKKYNRSLQELKDVERIVNDRLSIKVTTEVVSDGLDSPVNANSEQKS